MAQRLTIKHPDSFVGFVLDANDLSKKRDAAFVRRFTEGERDFDLTHAELDWARMEILALRKALWSIRLDDDRPCVEATESDRP